MKSLDKVLEELKNLPEGAGSAPFWAWNDKLEKEELSLQIGDMASRGMSGFFIHSREGLETEYLSGEWMDCVRHSIAEAEKNNLDVWIYDEDKWPSGSAGGIVSAADPRRFTARALTAELLTPSRQEACVFLEENLLAEGTAAVYALRVSSDDPSRLESFVRCRSVSDLPGEDRLILLILRVEISGPSEWYNGLAPTDNLNPDAVSCFLDVTHEKYRGLFGDDFGGRIRGFFTDEPNFCDFFSSFTAGRPWLPWSVVLEDFYSDKRGRSIIDTLPLLFFHGEGEEKARYDYWLTLTELFVSSYTRQIYDWCDKNNVLLTGHVLYENDLGYSARVSGSSMPHYRYMHAPGIDILGDQIQEYLTVKQCTSVANQFGRETVLTETYGCTGWDFSFTGQKCLGDWQFVMGVNKRCQHLALYSLSGCRKRDYPPVFNYNTTWWEHNRILEEYFSRLSVCVSSGSAVRKILCLHPMSSIWTKSGSDINEDLGHMKMNMGWLDDHILSLNKEGDSYNQLAKKLLMSQFDFDFGDELILESDGGISEGMIRVGTARYEILIVPRVDNLMSSTLNLMKAFLKEGGRILWTGPLPRLLDGEPSNLVQSLKEYENLFQADNYSELLDLLNRFVDRPVRITDDYGTDREGFLTMVREVENGQIITVVNTDREKACDVNLHFAAAGSIRRYNPLDNSSAEAGVETSASGSMTLQTRFDRGETAVFLVDARKPPLAAVRTPVYRHPHDVEDVLYSFGPRAGISLSMENALILDTCRFKLGGEEWTAETQVWQGQRRIRETLGMQQIYYNGAPQRYSWINGKGSDLHIPVGMEFRFTVSHVPEKPVYAVIEKSADYTVTCNGEACTLSEGYYIDRSMLRHKLPVLKEGENILEIAVPYTLATELEDIFIVGDFGVTHGRIITAPPESLQFGDWCYQGLFHYPGSVTYRLNMPPAALLKEGEKHLLKLGTVKGTLTVIRVNGREKYISLNGREKVDITGSLHTDRDNVIDVEVVGSPRNMFGPFHQTYTGCSRISWEDFRTEGIFYTPDYTVKPSGIFEEIVLVKESS